MNLFTYNQNVKSIKCDGSMKISLNVANRMYSTLQGRTRFVRSGALLTGLKNYVINSLRDQNYVINSLFKRLSRRSKSTI